ncbi:MAG: ComEC/Rec2 family competence protein [Candidatus Spechtbacterales bacterium]
MKIFSKKQKYILWGFLGVAVLSLSLAYISIPSGALEVHFLDVGQGDAVFIETPSGRQILIDSGRPDSPILERLSNYMPFYDRDIDIVVATHMDADHIGGLVHVLENFEVDMMLVNSGDFTKPLSEKLFKIAKEKNIPIIQAGVGDKFTLDEEVFMYTLHPSSGFLNKDENEASLVFKLVYKNDSFLFTADIGKVAEYTLAQSGIDISADVLKVGHHGSNTSSVKYFLDKVGAKLAVIQVGENNYGHPHPAVLRRLKDLQVLRNDLNGDITIYSYGDSI